MDPGPNLPERVNVVVAWLISCLQFVFAVEHPVHDVSHTHNNSETNRNDVIGAWASVAQCHCTKQPKPVNFATIIAIIVVNIVSSSSCCCYTFIIMIMVVVVAVEVEVEVEVMVNGGREGVHWVHVQVRESGRQTDRQTETDKETDKHTDTQAGRTPPPR